MWPFKKKRKHEVSFEPMEESVGDFLQYHYEQSINSLLLNSTGVPKEILFSDSIIPSGSYSEYYWDESLGTGTYNPNPYYIKNKRTIEQKYNSDGTILICSSCGTRHLFRSDLLKVVLSPLYCQGCGANL